MVAVATIVVYDCIINLDREIDLIWNRKLTFVSWLYFICRYLSVAMVIFAILITTTFSLSSMGCTAVSQTYTWSSFVLTVATHAIMVLRIHAMFHKSKAILALLLVAFLAMDVFNIIGIIPSTEHRGHAENVLLMWVCTEPNSWNYKMFVSVTRIPDIAFGLLLLGLAFFGYYQHAVERKRYLGIWSVNSWMKLLLTQNMIYFIVVVGCSTVTLTAGYFNETQLTLLAFGPTLVSLQSYILAPRLLLSFRGYHSRPTHSRGSSADSAFGISTYASTDKDFSLPYYPISLGHDSRASSRIGIRTWDAMTG